MATVSKLAAVLSGLVQNVDLTSSDLVTNSVWVGGTTSSPSLQVTPTLLNSYLVNPMTTAGDIIYENNTPATARLPIGSTGNVLTVVGGLPSWQPPASGGTVTSVSVVTANGLAGTVATATTTPAITLSTTVTGVLQGNGTAISAATTTGTGSVVLATSPSVTGLSSDTLTASGAITSTSGNISATAGTVSGTNLTTGGHASADLALAGGTMSGAINMGSNQINNLATPSASTDAANKSYVDAAIAGLTWQGPAKAYANSNVALTGGATLTIDSYSVQNGDLVILGNQTTTAQNGEYTASGIGTAYVLTANGLPTAAGDAWLILNGTTYADSAFVANSAVPTATFTEFAGPTAYTFTSPLSLSGRTVSVGYDNSTIGDNGSNQLYVPTSGITSTQLASASVTTAKLGTITDGTTLDQSGAGSTLEIKAAGVGTTQLASASVTAAKLGSVTDGTTLDQSGAGSTIEIKAAGVGTTQLAAASVTAAKLGTVTDGVTTDQNGSGSTIEVLQSPKVATSQTAGASFTANTSYLVRWALTGETAGRMYAADSTTASQGKFYAFGIFNSATSVSAGNAITVTSEGNYTLGSSDTSFTTGQVGLPVYLTSAGAFSLTPPSATGSAVWRVGMVSSTTTIWMGDKQLNGVN